MRRALDLRCHGIDEAAGRTLVLNGSEYVLHNVTDEGGETFIFPLENTRTGLILFLAKVFKFRPGSQEYKERLRTETNGFVLQLVGIDCVHEEQYEIPGALMKFQLHQAGGTFLGHDTTRESSPIPSTPRAHWELVKLAQNLMKSYDRPAAISVLRQVLELNPQHSLATVLLAELYTTLRDPLEVVRWAKAGLDVEPNDVRLYSLAARAHIALGQPDEALAVLNSALQRYEWDYMNWGLKREVATRFAMRELLDELAEEIQIKLFGVALVNDRIRDKVASDFRERRNQLASFHREADKASDLADAISLLLEVSTVAEPQSRLKVQFANGHAIFRIGERWKDEWLGRVIAFLACSWFLVEPIQAAGVYGGLQKIMELMQSESVEAHFLKGFSGIFRGDTETVGRSFRAAATLKGSDPFVLFGLILAGRINADVKRDADQAMETLSRSYADHPILALARQIRG